MASTGAIELETGVGDTGGAGGTGGAGSPDTIESTKHLPVFKLDGADPKKQTSVGYASKFQLVGTRFQYANSLRRLIEAEVETIGFRSEMLADGSTSDIKIITNDTSMTNETLAHRISLIPIYVKNPISWNPDMYLFSISVHGEKDKYRDVTCADFVIRKKKTIAELPVDSKDAEKGIDYEVVPTEQFFPGELQKCLIIVLEPGISKKLEFTAKATRGCGKEHGRFRPTYQCSYKNTLDPTPETVQRYFKQWLAQYKKAGHITDETSEEYKQYRNEFNTMEINRVYLKDKSGEPYSFDFEIKSIGVLPVFYIVKRALDIGMAMVQRYFMIEPKILMDEGAGAGAGGRGGAGAGAGKRAKAEAMTGAILPALPVDLRIVPTQGLKMEGYDFIFENHDHTLGNLLQTWLVDNLISLDQKKKPTEDNPIIYFAGYNVPHPLENKMVLTIGCSSEFTARRAVVKACRGIHALFQHMALQWALVAKL